MKHRVPDSEQDSGSNARWLLRQTVMHRSGLASGRVHLLPGHRQPRQPHARAVDSVRPRRLLVASASLLPHSIDTLLHSTSLIIAETLTDFQSVTQLIHPPARSSHLTSDAAASDDFSHIPILNTEWVYDTHSNYRVCDIDAYVWRRGFFSNITFCILEFKRDADAVKRSIEANDGKVVDEPDKAMYWVCPRTVDSDVFRDDRAVSARWLKMCLEMKKLVPRNSSLLYRPFPRLLKDCVVCLTGFGYDDKVKMESLVM